MARRCSQERELGQLGGLIVRPDVRDLLAGIFGASPYLTGLIERDPAGLLRALSTSPEKRFATLVDKVAAAMAAADAFPEAMRVLRLFKADIALLIVRATLLALNLMKARSCLHREPLIGKTPRLADKSGTTSLRLHLSSALLCRKDISARR